MNSSRIGVVLVGSLLFQGLGQEVAASAKYNLRDIEGWSVHVNSQLIAEKPDLARDALKLLEHQLYQINFALPRRGTDELHKIPIWVELQDVAIATPCCYHESAEWLRDHGIAPEKAKGVEIADPAKYIEWMHDQPWMTLHELAHGFHDRVLSVDDGEITAAYQHMLKSGRYESVLRTNGVKERHYALRNTREYFAESTEAYFGTNDYYPFVRGELLQVDPDVCALLKRFWGE